MVKAADLRKQSAAKAIKVSQGTAFSYPVVLVALLIQAIPVWRLQASILIPLM